MRPITDKNGKFYFSTVTTRLSQFKKLYYSQYIDANFYIKTELIFVRVRQILNGAFNRKQKLFTVHENKIINMFRAQSAEN